MTGAYLSEAVPASRTRQPGHRLRLLRPRLCDAEASSSVHHRNPCPRRSLPALSISPQPDLAFHPPTGMKRDERATLDRRCRALSCGPEGHFCGQLAALSFSHPGCCGSGWVGARRERNSIHTDGMMFAAPRRRRIKISRSWRPGGCMSAGRLRPGLGRCRRFGLIPGPADTIRAEVSRTVAQRIAHCGPTGPPGKMTGGACWNGSRSADQR